MEGHSNYSDKQHQRFLMRFKGKVTAMDKTGHVGLAASSIRPIEKSHRKYEEIYRATTLDPDGGTRGSEIMQ